MHGEQRRVAIMGGGVSGLSCALALSRIGVETHVFEGASKRRSGGGAVWLWPNATRALEKLGAHGPVLEAGQKVYRQRVMTLDGELLWDMPIAEMEERYGAPYLFIERSELVRALEISVPEGVLQYDSAGWGYADLGDQVRPMLHGRIDRSLGTFDGLVGAEGFRSTVRCQLLGEMNERVAGAVAVGSSVLPRHGLPLEEGTVLTLMGQGLLFVLAATHGPSSSADDLRVFWAAGTPLALQSRKWDAELIRRLYEPWPWLVQMMDASADARVFPVRDRAPSEVWGQGRVTLAGDSVHPVMPDLGQGAGQGVEGATVLAHCLSKSTDLPSAFRAYEWTQRRRTKRILEFGHGITVLRGLPLPGLEAFRKLGVRLFWPAILSNEFRFLFGEENVPSLMPPTEWITGLLASSAEARSALGRNPLDRLLESLKI